MFIEIQDLKPEPLHIQHVYEIADFKFARPDVVLDQPVMTDFTLTHKDRKLHISGTVEIVIRFGCARCLGEFIRRVATSFDLFYLPHPKSGKIDEEIELNYEDLDVGFYDGVRLDVDLMVLEQIELALPMRFICTEECKGLCHNCGVNLNSAPCRCEAESVDSRLAVLLDFRKKMDKR